MITAAKKVQKTLLYAFMILYPLVIFPSPNAPDIFREAKSLVLLFFPLAYLVITLLLSSSARPSDLPEIFKGNKTFVFFGIIYVMWVALSSTLSKTPLEAWFGNPSLKIGGMFFILSFLIFWVFSSNKLNLKFLYILITTISIISILEFVGFRPLSPITERFASLETAFPAATIGHRGQLAGLLLLFSTWSAIDVFKSKFNVKTLFLSVLPFVALGTTTNSSALLALCIFFLVFIGIVLVSKMKISRQFLAYTVLCMISLLSFYPLRGLNNILVDKKIVSASAITKDITSSTTLETRFLLWKAALRMTVEKPVLGWGTGTYSNYWYSFLTKDEGDELLRKELGILKGDKFARINDSVAVKRLNGEKFTLNFNYIAPHNAILDISYSQGIVGLILLIAFYGSIVRFAWKENKWQGIIMILPFLAYLIYLQGWFPVIGVTDAAACILGATLANMRKGSTGDYETTAS